MELLDSFGKDFFISTSSSSPTIIVPTGYEDCVYVNGRSVSKLISMTPHHTNAPYIGDVSIGGTSYRSLRLYTTGNSIVGADPSTLTVYNAYDGSKQKYISPDSSTYYKTSDSSLFITDIIPAPSVSDAKLINLNEFQYGDVTNTSMIFDDMNFVHVHIDSSTAFSFVMRSSLPDESMTFDYNPGLTGSEKYRKAEQMVDNSTSYELLRVNPKLTGNIKVVVDSSNNMYLDTFKVSESLSQKKYRKLAINPEEYYGRLLMSRYSSMNSTDFYKIEDSCYSMFSIANNLGDQYYDVYNMGVRTNNDSMYSENFSMLAPLYINKKMPDFFLIFKVKDYENLGSNEERIKYFLSNGEIVKVFDMRHDTNLGKFMRNVYEQSKNFVGDLYVSYDYDKSNVYNGISLDRGVVSQIYESASYERAVSNQVSMNDWYTLGYERNRIVSKNIVNFEFMFNDPSEKLFSINTYFGLYVSLNGEKEDFHCIRTGESIPVFDTSVSGSTFIPSNEKNVDLIYALTTPDSFIRLRKNIFDANPDNPVKQYINKPYKNIGSPKILDFGEDFDEKSYISMVLNDVLDPGEHFRIVDTNRKKIYEVVISNWNDERFDISEIDEYTQITNDGHYRTYRICIYNIPYRNNTSLPEELIANEVNILVSAFNMFDENTFTAYSDGINTMSLVYNYDPSSSPTDVLFEKVCSFYAMDHNEFVLEDGYSDKSTSVFGFENDEKILLDPLNQNTEYLYPIGYEALGHRFAYISVFLPLVGDDGRAYLINEDVKEFLSNEKSPLCKEDIYRIYNGFTYYTLGSDLSLVEHKSLTLSGFGEEKSYVVFLEHEPEVVNGCMMFYSNYPLNAGLCSIFQIKDLYTDVLDADNNISTNYSDYITENAGEYTNEENIYNHALSNVSEESVMDYFDKYERYTSYKDSSGNSVEIRALSPNNLTEYLSTMNAENHKLSDISLMTPYCCKWKSVGTNAAGNQLRVMFDFNVSSPNHSYFIPTDSSAYIGHVTVKGYDSKTTFSLTDSSADCPLSPNCNIIYNGESHLVVDVTDASTDAAHHYIKGTVTVMGYIPENVEVLQITVGSSGGTSPSGYLHVKDITHIPSTTGYSKYVNDNLETRFHTTFRRYLIDGEGSLDDIVVNNENGKAIMSKVYSYGNDSIEFISGGVKIRFTFNNDSIVKTSKYNGYSAMLICCAGNCPDGLHPCEIVIDEVHEQIAFIIYNGSTSRDMIYNKYNNPGASGTNLNIIPNIYPIYRTSPIYNTRIIYIGSQKSALFVDDASFGYMNAQLIAFSPLPSSNKGALILTSPAYYLDSYDRDKFNMLTAHLVYHDNDPEEQTKKYYPSDYVPEYFVGTDASLFIDSSFVPTTTTNIDIYGRKLYDNVDGFIVRDGQNIPPIIPDSSIMAPATLPLWKVKEVLVNSKLYIKTQEKTYNYTDLNNIVNIEIIDPIEITREDVNFKKETISGTVQPSFCEPVTKDMFVFDDYDYSGLSESFDKNFQGSNIRIKDVNILDQIWLRKMSEKPLTTTRNADVTIIDEIVAVCETDLLGKTLLHVNDQLMDPAGNIYYVSEISNESVVDSSITITDSSYFDSLADATDQLSAGKSLFDEMSQYMIIDSSIVGFDFEENKVTGATLTVIGEIQNGTTLSTEENVNVYTEDSSSYQKTRFTVYSTENTIAPISGIFTNLTQNQTLDVSVISSETIQIEQTLSFKTIISTTGFSVLHGMNPMIDCWHSNLYRKFTDLDSYTEENGVQSGYEKNTFFTSRGINLYGLNIDNELSDNIELTNWRDTVIDEKNKEITLNISESLLKFITFSNGYLENWESIYIYNPQNKIRYVENTIMKYIDITKYLSFELYRKPHSTLSLVSTNSFDGYTKIKNFKNTLFMNHGKYYMRISNLDKYEYAAKLTVKL